MMLVRVSVKASDAKLCSSVGGQYVMKVSSGSALQCVFTPYAAYQ